MRKTLVTLGIATACLLGPAAAADAATSGHYPGGTVHGTHTGTCPTKCVPKPKPPAGGWPCMKAKDCKPHKPHCPPVKPPVTPPVKPPWHAHPGKPVVHPPAPHHPLTPVVHVKTAAYVTPTHVPQLAYTGAPADMWPLLGTGGALLLAGSALFLAAGFKQSGPTHRELTK